MVLGLAPLLLLADTCGAAATSADSFERGGRWHRIDTRVRGQVTKDHDKRNLAFIGGGAGAGASIGGLAGGGRGALIGAGSGSAAGTAGAAVTGRRNARLPAESLLSFRLRAPVKLPAREQG